MKTSDITQVVLVVLVFTGVMFANVASAGIEHVKENWPEYRCNPGIIPFASMFGHDAMTNFSDCISNMQIGSMAFLTAPFSMNMSVLTGDGKGLGDGGAQWSGGGGGLGGSLTGSTGAGRGMFAKIRASLSTITQSVFAVFLNLMIEIQKLFMNMKDLVSKLVGTIATVLFFVKTGVIALVSVWKGPPGQMIKALCFDPLTRVALEDGTVTAMRDLEPGSRLRNGARVCAVMDLSNLGERGKPVEAMYRIPGGEGGAHVVVSGSHLVFDPHLRDYVPVRELDPDRSGARLDGRACPRLSCLITSDHTVPIGKWVFHDWEDNVGSSSKSIG